MYQLRQAGHRGVGGIYDIYDAARGFQPGGLEFRSDVSALHTGIGVGGWIVDDGIALRIKAYDRYQMPVAGGNRPAGQSPVLQAMLAITGTRAVIHSSTCLKVVKHTTYPSRPCVAA